MWKDEEDNIEEMELCNVPTGSEGSIQYKILIDFSEYSTPTIFTIPIYGDLRDFEFRDTLDIEEWFNKIVYLSKLEIRSGIIEILCESGMKVLQYHPRE
jgi:hypothetical protein